MKQRVYVAAGHLCMALAVVGIFLPVMPSVVFVILAAACYARGNPALKRKLLAHPTFGPPIRAWEEDRAVSVRGKLSGIVMVTVGIAASLIWFVEATWLGGVLLAMWGGIVGFLLGVNTKR